MLIFIANFVWSQVFARVPVGPNPWASKSIEWQLPSPVPVHNFDHIPTFGPDPYPYGEIDERGQPPPSRRRRGRRRDRAREPRDRLLGRRTRAAGCDGEEPPRRLAPLGVGDRVLLLRLPLRLLLSAVAELAWALAAEARRPAADDRRARDARDRRRRGARQARFRRSPRRPAARPGASRAARRWSR